MARTKKYKVYLTDNEVKTLKSIISKKKTSKTIKCRCQILLDIDEAHGKAYTHEQSAKSNGVCIETVSNTIRQYFDEGLESVTKLKRSVNSDNAKRKVDGRVEAKLIEIACGSAPEGHSRWTLLLLEEKAKVVLDVPVSKDTIGRALKKQLRPHHNDYWCIPKKEDAVFIAAMKDVLDVYEHPYDESCPVVCMGKKPISFLEIQENHCQCVPEAIKSSILNISAKAPVVFLYSQSLLVAFAMSVCVNAGQHWTWPKK